jgi:hypothetical protein
MAVMLSALRAGRPSSPPEDFGNDLRTIVSLEVLGKLKKIHLIRTRTRDISAYSTVPHQTTLSRASLLFVHRHAIEMPPNQLLRFKPCNGLR